MIIETEQFKFIKPQPWLSPVLYMGLAWIYDLTNQKRYSASFSDGLHYFCPAWYEDYHYKWCKETMYEDYHYNGVRKQC